MKRSRYLIAPLLVLCTSAALTGIAGFTLDDFFLPGSQPGQSGNLETPDKCDNCHGGYDIKAEPAFNWRGNMMAQAARDPFFYACMTIANQDAPFSGDLCIRCHSPAGWLEGRSTPTDGSALNLNDRQGVQCDFCHKLVKPTPLNTNPYPGDAAYLSMGTYAQDQSYLANLSIIPTHSANGMYICDANNAKRGPYTNPVAKHQFFYSPYHKDAALCGTCHDVSNPAFEKAGEDPSNPNSYLYVPNALNTPSPSFSPYDMFPVERTFSEWTKSSFNTPAGVSGTKFGGNKTSVSTCQDCHMRDITGKGCNKAGVPVRNDLALHDMTGGNTWVPDILPAFFPGETNAQALAAGKQRAAEMLALAADLQVTGEIPNISVKITNNTGHKLPSGYPEGRRIWINVKAFDAGNNLLSEFGAYDYSTAVLTTSNTKVYEVKLGMSEQVAALANASNYADGSSFHFVLNNVVVKDNRIPPLGFTNANFKAIQSPPVKYSYADGQNWDVTDYTLPVGTASYVVSLMYQTVSKEYMDFLRDENKTNTYGQQVHNAWSASGMSAPVLMTSYRYGAPIADTEPPTTPTGLTATAPKFNIVNLSWNPSTDNVAVTGYRVYRADKGGSPIATVTTTTYSDATVSQTTSYTYSVEAFDAAFNASGKSSVTVATPVKSGKTKKEASLFTSAGTPILSLSPNPLRYAGSAVCALSEAGDIQLDIIDARGALIVGIERKGLNSGLHSLPVDLSRQPAGTYFFRLRITPAGSSRPPVTTTIKGVLLR